jgi:hypothetical protein
MRTPYFYIIQHEPSGNFYAGCKINSYADSSNLMTEHGYKTTSKIVKKLIKEDGLSSFKILKIKHFGNKEDTLDYETKFLQKVNAAKNPKFLNLHNGGKNFVNKGGYKLSESTKNKMRKPKSKEAIEKQKEALIKRDKEIYRKMVETRKSKGIPWISDEQREKIKEFNKKYWNDENIDIQKNRMIDYYKNNPIKEETRNKLKTINSGENNKMFGKKHKESSKEKMRIAWLKRKEKRIDTSTESDKLQTTKF